MLIGTLPHPITPFALVISQGTFITSKRLDSVLEFIHPFKPPNIKNNGINNKTFINPLYKSFFIYRNQNRISQILILNFLLNKYNFYCSKLKTSNNRKTIEKQ